MTLAANLSMPHAHAANAADPYAEAPAASGADLRAAPRFTLMLRCAKLIADGHELICVLRDASDTGVKVRLFHPLPPARQFELEMPDGSRHAMDCMWERESHAGFHFRRPVDMRSLLDERSGQVARRQLRMRVGNSARLIAHGDAAEVRLLNISQQGACIESEAHLLLREMVRIEAGSIPPIYAKVCWRQAPRYGLVFEKGFQLDELARFLAQCHEGGAPLAK